MMKLQKWAFRSACSLAAILLLGAPARASAQDDLPSASADRVRWALYDGIGYGGMGFGLGLIAAWDMEGSGFGPPGVAIATIIGATVAGTVAGTMIGRRAQNVLDTGQPLTGAHRVAAMGGVALFGAALGALAAIPLVDGEGEGTFLGSDEQTVTLTVVSGGALGWFYIWNRRDDFSSRQISVSPTARDGAYGFRARLTF